MSTDGLVEFVAARLDEDERIAREVEQRGPWRVAGSGYLFEENYGAFALDPHGLSVNGGEHIVRHDPARVLRELPLKRRLLDEHRPRPIVDPDGKERDDWPERVCRICDPRWMGTPDWAQGEDFVPPEPECCEYLRLLAAVYADHPDYRSEWSPA